jgi:hypothetical protein
MPHLKENLQGYFSVLAIGNLDGSGYPRGLQFIRLGIKQDKMMYGIASNLTNSTTEKRPWKTSGHL